jgi:hypothetical protein
MLPLVYCTRNHRIREGWRGISPRLLARQPTTLVPASGNEPRLFTKTGMYFRTRHPYQFRGGEPIGHAAYSAADNF